MFKAEVKIIRNRYRELSRQGREAAKRRNVELAEGTLERAKKKVHVITGKTRDSGKVVVNQRTGTASVEFSEGAIFEEYGTIHRPPHPFLGPATKEAAKHTRNRTFRMYK